MRDIGYTHSSALDMCTAAILPHYDRSRGTRVRLSTSRMRAHLHHVAYSMKIVLEKRPWEVINWVAWACDMNQDHIGHTFRMSRRLAKVPPEKPIWCVAISKRERPTKSESEPRVRGPCLATCKGRTSMKLLVFFPCLIQVHCTRSRWHWCHWCGLGHSAELRWKFKGVFRDFFIHWKLLITFGYFGTWPWWLDPLLVIHDLLPQPCRRRLGRIDCWFRMTLQVL